MQSGLFFKTSITIFAAVVLTLPDFAVVQSRATETTVTKSKIQIPKSVQAEHEAIHSALVETTQAAGRVGSAAKELAQVLHPHFVREEQIALPPLGLLAPLTTGEHVPETVLSEALAMTDTVKSEFAPDARGAQEDPCCRRKASPGRPCGAGNEVRAACRTIGVACADRRRGTLPGRCSRGRYHPSATAKQVAMV
jgi:hypothetical protein